ncbi:deoxyribodipyrimidine photolyase [Flavobacterium pallidum]|uniref:Deoxyribodipyrimidine photolyase n=1 Tax=Flavobacterium pallidum TaxID=2172098 RepID=A0A2S1SLM5_9FLAO|nr:deoxyribodipyrimidine photolyase [Flavobacterium pallidum]
MNIFWFRRDLRLDDNRGFYEALTSGLKVLPMFIFDDKILSELPKDDARVTFIHSLLDAMNEKLKESKCSLAVFHGDPAKIFEDLIRDNQIETIFTNHDYEPYARKRDKAVYQVFKENNIAFKTYKDQVIFEKDEIIKEDGKPYVVFTPYSNKWLEHFHKTDLKHFPSENHFDKIAAHSHPFPSLKKIGFQKSGISVPEYNISKDLVHNYEGTRNFPALDKTSKLSPHLRFGAVPIRKMVQKANQESNKTFLKELIWREFFMQILWHFPHTVNKSFRPKYDNIKWIYSEVNFKKWCEGKTGYPIVDAGMRELNETGHMHNRVRMVVASFLCKHLLIDWRWGEAYFAEKLLDYEQSSNVGNWQWAAGSGVDAAPYFRIFNPAEQAKKFDKDGKYIRRWVREFDTDSYPEPIVDHKEARERCLKVFKEALV